MQPLWNGFGFGLSNVLPSIETLLTAHAMIVTLSDTPGLVTRITLPASTRIIRLWSTEESLRLALDADPLAAGASSATLIAASVLTLGDTVLPGEWYAMAIPDDTLTHVCHLMAPQAVSPQLHFVALVEE